MEHTLLRLCESSLDPYTSSFLEHHKGQLSEPPALLELAAIVLHGNTSTVTLESLNASLRRRLVSASVQVSTPDFHSISAEFMLGKMRRRSYGLLFPPGHRHFRARSARKQRLSKAPKKRKGGGGAFRAYMKQRGEKFSRGISDEYRQLSAAAKAKLQQRGALGTAAHNMGAAAFGGRQRVLPLITCRLKHLIDVSRHDTLKYHP